MAFAKFSLGDDAEGASTSLFGGGATVSEGSVPFAFGGNDSVAAYGGAGETMEAAAPAVDYSPGSEAPNKLELLAAASGEVFRLQVRTSTVVGDTQLMPSYMMPLPPPADPQLADIRAAVDGLRVLAGIETVIVEPCADAATLSSSVEAKFADQVRGSALSVAMPINPRPFPYI